VTITPPYAETGSQASVSFHAERLFSLEATPQALLCFMITLCGFYEFINEVQSSIKIEKIIVIFPLP